MLFKVLNNGSLEWVYGTNFSKEKKPKHRKTSNRKRETVAEVARDLQIQWFPLDDSYTSQLHQQ